MMEITATQAAERLEVSPRRVRELCQSGQLDARKIGSGRRGIWLIDGRSVDRRLLIKQAQRAWEMLKISPRLWGRWWLADPNEIESFRCPECGRVAYSPAGATKYSARAACPRCGWTGRAR